VQRNTAAARTPDPSSRSILPAPFQDGRFRARFAATSADVDAVLRLRFEVFNVELKEGLSASWVTGRDQDEFDAQFDHLMVEEVETGRPVGTYRLQIAAMAEAGRGFYSAGEFDLSALPAGLIDQAVELGRACVAREFRNRQVLYLLWKGLARYWAANDKRYLFGCSSITTEDPAVGAAALDQLRREGHVHPTLVVRPRAGLECVPPQAAGAAPAVTIPILLRTYLRFSGKICGTPAVDRAFKTIDFFTLVDTENLRLEQRRLLSS